MTHTWEKYIRREGEAETQKIHNADSSLSSHQDAEQTFLGQVWMSVAQRCGMCHLATDVKNLLVLKIQSESRRRSPIKEKKI